MTPSVRARPDRRRRTGLWLLDLTTTKEPTFLADSSAVAVGSLFSAVEILGTAGLNIGNNAAVGAMSYRSGGNGSAIGSHASSPGVTEGFAIDQIDGSWHNAVPVPDSAVPNVSKKIRNLFAISCSSAGSCTPAGTDVDSLHNARAIVEDDTRHRTRLFRQGAVGP